MKKHIPNSLTCLNLITGAIGCIAIIRGNSEWAIYFVLISAFFDFLDGFAARLLHVQSAIGKELDSLADVISFGLLPSLFVFAQLEQQLDQPYLPYVALLIGAFSAIRLAKFNTDDRQSDQFIGLPTPANALLLTSLPLLPSAIDLSGYPLLALALVTCYLLVAPLPMIALKFNDWSWKNNQLKYSLVILIVLLVAMLQLKALPFVIPAYVVLSIIGNFRPAKDV
ncbi:CDP-diacylglycerol--serine O-phosphatidyltransferase [Marinoscillum furvescens]|uniref:CDP-diacylglycerol--serine O-phosphatidyltransferase n=1 Tax=Marinoscillum furvescens DSM 4134 TaxID=1122208 RepID=A0A3D9L5N6_MARFU|nr:CDP-diacylglycerol--serine O-phosphatidyltransferase [Marinoscillum furvescens]RED99742.1 CDP-diacylglycerol--serine O-phosphatidyltransferase [Marinoscillum furvescens DSM 4134]